jgi:membrane protease YdiL (CAAX protease family)
MKKLVDWLSQEAEVRQIAGFVLLAALVDVALLYTVKAALINWGIVTLPPTDPAGPQNPFHYYNVVTFISILVQAPLFEETIFRLVPLTLVIFFTKKPLGVLSTVVIFAVLFGAIHPYGAIGRAQVAIAGLVFGVLFLKCGGLNSRFVKAWLGAMAAHSVANLFILGAEYYDYLERVL